MSLYELFGIKFCAIFGIAGLTAEQVFLLLFKAKLRPIGPTSRRSPLVRRQRSWPLPNPRGMTFSSSTNTLERRDPGEIHYTDSE